MVKVFKSVGAVRVYNGWNAAGAAVGLALLIAGIGFAIGWIANNDNGTSSGSSAAVSDAAGRQAAYQNGLAAGRSQSAATASKTKAAPAPAPKPVVSGTFGKGFKAGTAYSLGTITKSGSYFVQVGSGKKGLHVGPHVAATAGRTYWVCGGGTRVCYR